MTAEQVSKILGDVAQVRCGEGEKSSGPQLDIVSPSRPPPTNNQTHLRLRWGRHPPNVKHCGRFGPAPCTILNWRYLVVPTPTSEAQHRTPTRAGGAHNITTLCSRNSPFVLGSPLLPALGLSDNTQNALRTIHVGTPSRPMRAPAAVPALVARPPHDVGSSTWPGPLVAPPSPLPERGRSGCRPRA